MTDRDTFAAAALTGLLSNNYFSLGDEAAKRCYGYADAMLRERERPDRPQPIKPADATPDTHATPAAGSVHGECTITAEEREAIELAAAACGNCNGFGGDPTRPAIYRGDEIAAILRSLLERLAVK